MVDNQVDPISTGSTSTARMDFASILYLHPSENAGLSLLPGVFDSTGYRSWRRAVLRGLFVKSKTSFINGKIVKPNLDDPSFQQWERCDDMLQKEINDLVQGTLDVTGYYTKMKKLWEEMSTVDMNSQCNCVCTCGGKVKLIKAEQDKRLIHFLMGLNEMYNAIRCNILMINTLPSMAQSFAILSQDEKQREVKPYNHTDLDSTSLNVFASTHNNVEVKGRRSGHTRERCYKLHGYPPNSKFSKGKSSNSAMANMCSSEIDGNHCEEDPDLRKQMPLNLSKDQYEHLLNLLGSLQAGHGASNSDNMLSGAVNLTGPFSEEPSGTW
ncbi:hypothetical protein KY290_021681 [Solanum tuberosum]|uniref:Retrotransposon Copia-like N-terminal domain-containing protein n=1 Tax=Solanum tuberosum TaxID=4113 RepID=A0ABQ7V3B1_SOLTU|nr:hypothetical protein KY290_021681 [Solanum tuberosum]